MGEKMRIYVGGLGSSVLEPDLKKTFTSPQLGTVESVEIIRNKGRSFAYLEFLPVSDKGLAKLFSTYNGCLWKGGRLKLEKAKEHYLFRLRREWTEDAQLEVKLSGGNVGADESVHAIQKPQKDQDIEKMQLKLFFPKLRKIKPIPLKGTGRHKYSFQRVEVPPLPIHFCDCEEHCGPPEPAKRNYTDDQETVNYGVNEDELNMMKSILNRLLEKDSCSKSVSDEAELAEEISYDASLADKWLADDEEDQASDEDNLVINMLGPTSKQLTLFEDWGHVKTAANQESLVREPESFSNRVMEMDVTKKGKHILDKKRKHSTREDKSDDTVPSKMKGRKGCPHDNIDDPVVANTQPIVKESGSVRSSCDVASSNKSAWRALASEKGSTAFKISDILTDLNSEDKTNSTSDCVAAAPCLNEHDGQQDQSSMFKDLEKVSDIQSVKSAAFEDKSARGVSWLQKSSWLQLVGDAEMSMFNLGQILPDVTFEKQGVHGSFVQKDQNSPVGEPQGRTYKDIYATPNVDVPTKEQNDGAVDGEQSNSDSKEAAAVKEKESVLLLGNNVVPNNRAVGDIVISETCPFMKSAASMKEWVKSKAALSGSRKKKGEGNEKGVGPRSE